MMALQKRDAALLACLLPACCRRDSVAVAPSTLLPYPASRYAELVSGKYLPLPEAVGWPRPPAATGSLADAATSAFIRLFLILFKTTSGRCYDASHSLLGYYPGVSSEAYRAMQVTATTKTVFIQLTGASPVNNPIRSNLISLPPDIIAVTMNSNRTQTTSHALSTRATPSSLS